jgi:hypothetical protein
MKKAGLIVVTGFIALVTMGFVALTASDGLCDFAADVLLVVLSCL